jgi:hypothetical protein
VADGLNASAVLTFAADGVTWRLSAPLKAIVSRWDSPGSTPPPRN